jgi:hypothetical protein
VTVPELRQINLVAREIDASVAFSAAGYRAQQAPYDAFWGARYAIVEDPDGNAIGLMGPADADSRYWPPTTPPKV